MYGGVVEAAAKQPWFGAGLPERPETSCLIAAECRN